MWRRMSKMEKNEEIVLIDILSYAKQGWRYIFGICFGALLVTGMYIMTITPKYEASVTLNIIPIVEKMHYSTSSVVNESDFISNKIKNDIELLGKKNIADSSVEAVFSIRNDKSLYTITAMSPDPEKVKDILICTVRDYKEKTKQDISSQINETGSIYNELRFGTTENSKEDLVRYEEKIIILKRLSGHIDDELVITQGDVDTLAVKRISPKSGIYLTCALVIGVILGILVSYVKFKKSKND